METNGNLRYHRNRREICQFGLTNEGSPPPRTGPLGAHSGCVESADGDQHSEPLQRQLTRSLESVSRLKLRAFVAALVAAATAEGALPAKELNRLAGEHQMPLSQRLLDRLALACVAEIVADQDDDGGSGGGSGTAATSAWVDSDAAALRLMSAHSQTRRESVQLSTDVARQDAESAATDRAAWSSELTRRVVDQLTLHRRYVNLDAIRRDLRKRDASRSGLLPKRAVVDVCARHDNPVYGSVLAAVLRRFKDTASGTVRWQKFVKFLQQAQQAYFESHPEAPRQESARTVSTAVTASLQSLGGNSSAASSASWSTVTLASTESGEEPFEEKVNNALKIPEPQASTKQKQQQPQRTINKGGSKSASIIAAHSTPNHSAVNRHPGNQSQNRLSVLPVAQAPELLSPTSVSQPTAMGIRQLGISFRFGERKVTCPDDLDWALDEAVNAEEREAPDARLELDWVYGYRGNDCRHNLVSVPGSGQLAYPIGRVVVLLRCVANAVGNKQRHYREHQDEVKCVCVHPDGLTMASGGCGGGGGGGGYRIRVWNSANLDTAAELDHQSSESPSVVGLAFLNSECLISVDDCTPQPQLKLWQLRSRSAPLAVARPAAAVVCDIAVRPGSSEEFATVGRGHIAWWRYHSSQDADQSDDYSSQRLQLVREGDTTALSAKYIVSTVYCYNGQLVTGDSSGGIAVWSSANEDFRLQRLLTHAHQGPVFALLELSLNNHCWLLSGGRDGRLAVWRVPDDIPETTTTTTASEDGDQNQTTTPVAKSFVALPEEAAAGAGIRCISAVWIDSADQVDSVEPGHQEDDCAGISLALGTTANAIFLCRLPAAVAGRESFEEAEQRNHDPLTGASLLPEPLTAGHYDRLRCLAGLPSHPSVFVTAGYDSQVRMYSAETHRCLHTAVLQRKCVSSVLWHSSGTLVFGTRTGQLIILERSGAVLSQIFKRRVARHKITAIATSHSGEMLAIGDARGRIYFLQQRRRQQQQKQQRHHQSNQLQSPQRPSDQQNSVDPSEPAATEAPRVSWTIVGEVRTLRRAVEAIDFATDRFEGSLLLRASNRVAELAFCDATNFHLSTDEERFRNVNWSTHSCMCCYYSVGVWNSEVAAKRNITAMDACPLRGLLAVGLDTGQVLLYHLPCLNPKNGYRVYHGPGRIAGLKFVSDGARLVAVGGSEACIMQWSVL